MIAETHVAWQREAMLASPWFAGVRAPLGELPPDRFPDLDQLNALARRSDVTSGGGAPIRFVAAEAERGEAYESRIYRTGEVATRSANWHDLFNALVWLAFPRTKGVLNRVHHEALQRHTGGSARGTPRDVATLFDEGGLIVACADRSLADLLRGFRWRELFWQRRADVLQSMRFLVFGHAILERWLAPYKAVTAKALIVDVDRAALALPPADLVASLDAASAAHFARPEALASTRTLDPLPVLGIPGWTPESADPAYYDDTAVFRPGRIASQRNRPLTGPV